MASPSLVQYLRALEQTPPTTQASNRKVRAPEVLSEAGERQKQANHQRIETRRRQWEEKNADAESKGDKKTESKSGKKTESKGDKKTESKSGKKTESKSGKKTESKGDKKTESKSGKKTESKGDKKTESKGDKKTELKGDKKKPAAESKGGKKTGNGARGKKATEHKEQPGDQKQRTLIQMWTQQKPTSKSRTMEEDEDEEPRKPTKRQRIL